MNFEEQWKSSCEAEGHKSPKRRLLSVVCESGKSSEDFTAKLTAVCGTTTNTAYQELHIMGFHGPPATQKPKIANNNDEHQLECISLVETNHDLHPLKVLWTRLGLVEVNGTQPALMWCSYFLDLWNRNNGQGCVTWFGPWYQ